MHLYFEIVGAFDLTFWANFTEKDSDTFISFGVVGAGIFLTLFSFSGKGFIPFPETRCPKYWTCVLK